MNNLARTLISMNDERPVRLVYGTATGPNTVAVRGAATAVTLPAITPVDDGQYCAVLESGADRVIVGPVNAEQRGESFGTTNASGEFTVSFPTAFASTPAVIATARTTLDRFVAVRSVNASDFTVAYYDLSAADVAASAPIIVAWHAFLI